MVWLCEAVILRDVEIDLLVLRDGDGEELAEAELEIERLLVGLTEPDPLADAVPEGDIIVLVSLKDALYDSLVLRDDEIVGVAVDE